MEVATEQVMTVSACVPLTIPLRTVRLVGTSASCSTAFRAPDDKKYVDCTSNNVREHCGYAITF